MAIIVGWVVVCPVSEFESDPYDTWIEAARHKKAIDDYGVCECSHHPIVQQARPEPGRPSKRPVYKTPSGVIIEAPADIERLLVVAS